MEYYVCTEDIIHVDDSMFASFGNNFSPVIFVLSVCSYELSNPNFDLEFF